MKYFLLISIVCIVRLQSVWCKDKYELTPNQAKQVNLWLKECAQELNTFAYRHEYFYILNAYAHFYPGPRTDTVRCVGACFSRKFAESRGLTLYRSISDMIDMEYAPRAQNRGISKGARDDMKSKLEYCYAKESDECEFYKCLDLLKRPFSYSTAHRFDSLISYVFKYKFE